MCSTDPQESSMEFAQIFANIPVALGRRSYYFDEPIFIFTVSTAFK